MNLEREIRSLRRQSRLLWTLLITVCSIAVLSAANTPARKVIARSADGKSEVVVRADETCAEIRVIREGKQIVIWSSKEQAAVAVQGVRDTAWVDSILTADQWGGAVTVYNKDSGFSVHSNEDGEVNFGDSRSSRVSNGESQLARKEGEK